MTDEETDLVKLVNLSKATLRSSNYMFTCMFSNITHLSAKETKVQRTYITCPRSNRWQVQRRDYELGLFASMYHTLFSPHFVIQDIHTFHHRLTQEPPK